MARRLAKFFLAETVTKVASDQRNIEYRGGEMKEKRKSPGGAYGLTYKGAAYYLACKHGVCPKIDGGYDTTAFDKFWNEFEKLFTEEEDDGNRGGNNGGNDGADGDNIGDLRQAYTSARKNVAIASALLCIQLALLALQLILALFLN